MIDFLNVSKKYEDEDDYVFENFNLHIGRGELVVFTGSSGIGKTTLLQLLMKEIEPTSGEIIVDGKKLSQIRHGKLPYYRRQMGVIFQDFKLMPDLTAYENVRAAMVAVGAWNSATGMQRISSVFSMLGIVHLHNKRPEQMSFGERQKVCMARAIINYPHILVADEPTSNLDPTASQEIFQLLNLINKQGITVVVSTNDVEHIDIMNGRNIELGEAIGFTGLAKRLERNEEDNYED